MTNEDTLVELLGRLAARRGAPILITDVELAEWPAKAVAALKRHKMLVRTAPAKSVLCPGCEEACTRPLHHLTAPPQAARHFVLCDRRDDINRVQIPAERLTQWQCTTGAVCAFVAAALGLRHYQPKPPTEHGWAIGLVQGDRRSQMMHLQASPEGCRLEVSANLVLLADLILWGDGGFFLDRSRITTLIDAANPQNSRYKSSVARREARKLDTQALHESWQKAYRDLKRVHPGQSDSWLAQKIAKLPIAQGRSAETIRKHMTG